MLVVIFFFKQKTGYGMRISDWSSDVCSSDLERSTRRVAQPYPADRGRWCDDGHHGRLSCRRSGRLWAGVIALPSRAKCGTSKQAGQRIRSGHWQQHHTDERKMTPPIRRSEEHTSELQSLMRSSYAVFCLKKK